MDQTLSNRYLMDAWRRMRDMCCSHDSNRDMPKMQIEWYYDYTAFERYAMSIGMKPGTVLIRIDLNGDFIPSNLLLCKRKTHRSNAVIVTAFGQTKPLSWFVHNHPSCLVRDYHVVYGRIKIMGWNAERALTEISKTARPKPIRLNMESLITHDGDVKTIREWCDQLSPVVPINLIVKRLSLGWSLHDACSTPKNGRRPGKLSIPVG